MSSKNKQIKSNQKGNKNNSSHEVSVNKTIYQFKIILIGDSSVGKTSLVNRFMGMDYEENYACTINADFKKKSLSIDPSCSAELVIWDTCGQEKFKAITRQYFKDANGIILVYDVNNENSFKGLYSWLNEIYSNTSNDSCIVLVGNKIDISDRKVTKEEGEEFAKKNKLLYLETSSKNGINIEEPFIKVTNMIIQKVKDNPEYKGLEKTTKKIGPRNEMERQREKEFKCC